MNFSAVSSGTATPSSRSAVRLALDELDKAALTADLNPHLAQAARILDAVLNPEEKP